MKRVLCAMLIAMAATATAQQVTLKAHQLTINGEDMPWLLQTDGSQYEWVTDKYQWGNAYYDADGDIAVKTERRQEGDDLVETYVFTNTSKRKVTMKNVGIYTPFNDNYPDAKTCMTSRCNVHIWPGGKAAYVNAMRMSGVGPNLGLMVTEGEITDYDVWERGSKKGMSNFRGVFALCPPDMTLKPGQSYCLTWRLFSHNGTDFDEQLLHRGGTVVRSRKYVYAIGETARVDFITSKGTKTITKKITTTGEQRVDYKGTHALLLGISGEQELLNKRVRFILEHQQMNDSNDPRYGAFMVYDNEGDSILTDSKGRSDLDEGRERVGLGILLAEYCRRHPDKQMQEALIRYARFVREKMQQTDYTTGSSVMRKSKNRGYNYPWVADFYFRMYLLTGNKQYALDGYATLRSLYRYFGYGFYCIDYPVTVGLKALEQAGLTFERDQLLHDFKTTADIYLKNGLDFPKFEVNYEQSIIAPAVQFLCEVYLATGEKKHLNGAEQLLPALEALQWHQPSYRMNEIAIRHWDGYWFGKRQTYGDVYPHYWSCITAAAFHYYAKATGNQAYQQRAENIVRNNLSLFYEDGKATCAFVNPRCVNGNPAHYADAYANDQDWALMYYMEITQTEKAEWISVKDAPVVTGKASVVNRAADGASWFVTTVENEKEVVSAKWTTTALGVYELYLNGKPVGEEILKPGFTHYAKTRRAFTHDVTALLKKTKGAKNQLAAQVTPGWWADKIITPNNYDGMLGEKCAFRCVLELTFADGSRKCFGTNRKDWLAGIAGPVRHAAIFDGEEYDARIKPGYADVSQLKEPELNTTFKGEILPSEGAEVYLRKDLTLQPVKAYVWQVVTGAKTAEQKEQTEHGTIVIKRNYTKGETISLNPGETLVVDFGQNSAAVPSFVFKAKVGTKLTCLPSEILNDGNGAESRGMDGPEGSVHRRNLRMHKDGIRMDYTFGDSKDFVSYRPSCTFFGYRYISVTATDKVQIKKVESIPVSSITKEMETGSITTGNKLINQLISNTLWGQRSNYLSVPTDCPQRNERLGWTADTQVFAETGSFFANTDRFFHKWMRDMRDTQSEQGGFPGVAPAGQYGSGPKEMMRIGWADAGVIVPWTVWKQFGDKSIINENWEAMERFILHVDNTKYDHKALAAENGNYQWADWLSYEPLESCGGGAFDKNGPLADAITYWNYLGASYWAIDAAMMADMASATGRDATRYHQMVKAAIEYLKEQFLDENGNFKTAILNTMQTPSLFALRNGLVEGNAKQLLIQRLRKNFADHGNCLQTGFLGTSILMQTLTDNGMADIAYELLFQRGNPSWLYSIDNGATTIWERWNSYMIEHGMGPKGMNSFNHYAYGCVCQWLWEAVAGIAADTANPGFKHIVMKPLPDKRLGFVKAEYQIPEQSSPTRSLSAEGLIKSHWRYEGNLWIWDFTIPKGTTATVTLPGETEGKEYESGSHRITIPE